MRGGVFKRRRKGRAGVPSFHHIINFACVSQPKNSERDAYYAIHQIRAFYRIQETFARIIVHDVCTVGGMFYYDGAPLDNAEVERRLKAQGNIRLFTTKDGVHPFPAPKIVDV